MDKQANPTSTEKLEVFEAKSKKSKPADSNQADLDTKLTDVEQTNLNTKPTDLDQASLDENSADLDQASLDKNSNDLDQANLDENSADLDQANLDENSNDLAQANLDTKPTDLAQVDFDENPTDLAQVNLDMTPADLAQANLGKNSTDLTQANLDTKPTDLAQNSLNKKQKPNILRIFLVLLSVSLACGVIYTINVISSGNKVISSRNQEIGQLKEDLTLSQDQIATLEKDLEKVETDLEKALKENERLQGVNSVLSTQNQSLIKSIRFSDTEFNYVKKTIESFPTESFFSEAYDSRGNFLRDSFKVSISPGKRIINASITVNWQGTLSRTNHETSFDFEIHKTGVSSVHTSFKVKTDEYAEKILDYGGLKEIEEYASKYVSNAIDLEQK